MAATYEPCVASMQGIYFQIQKAGSNIFFFDFWISSLLFIFEKVLHYSAMPSDASESEEREEKEDGIFAGFVSTISDSQI